MDKVDNEDRTVKFVKDKRNINGKECAYAVWEGSWLPVEKVGLYANHARQNNDSRKNIRKITS